MTAKRTNKEQVCPRELKNRSKILAEKTKQMSELYVKYLLLKRSWCPRELKNRSKILAEKTKQMSELYVKYSQNLSCIQFEHSKYPACFTRHIHDFDSLRNSNVKSDLFISS